MRLLLLTLGLHGIHQLRQHHQSKGIGVLLSGRLQHRRRQANPKTSKHRFGKVHAINRSGRETRWTEDQQTPFGGFLQSLHLGVVGFLVDKNPGGRLGILIDLEHFGFEWRSGLAISQPARLQALLTTA